MTDPECQPLLTPSNPPGPRTRRWGIGCLIVVSFLQAFTYNGADEIYRHDILNLFRAAVQPSTAYYVLGTVLLYVLPTATSLYADVIVGKYTALYIGLVVKFTGELLAFCVVLKLETSDHNIDQVTVKVLAAVFSVSLTLVVVGLCSSLSLLVTFGAQQVKQKFESQSSFVRWCIAIFVTGFFTQGFLLSCDYSLPVYIHAPWLRSHPQTVYHAMNVILNGLSIAIFLLGKPSYNKPTTQEGWKSFKMLGNIARRHIICLPASRRYETNETSMRMRSLQEIVNTHKLERMKMRKGVITVALFSAVAVSLAMNIVLDQIVHKNAVSFPEADRSLFSWSSMPRGIVCVLLAPLMECVIRKCGYVLWQNNLANQLRTSGFGIVLTVLAFLTAGIMASILPHQDYFSGSPFYVLPLYILSGIALFMIISSVITFCLTECPPGLSTFVAVLFVNFSLLVLPLGIILDKVDWAKLVSSTDVACYVLAAITLVVLLVIYIPVSVWYVRADAACARLLAEEVSNSSDPERELTRSMSDGGGS